MTLIELQFMRSMQFEFFPGVNNVLCLMLDEYFKVPLLRWRKRSCSFNSDKTDTLDSSALHKNLGLAFTILKQPMHMDGLMVASIEIDFYPEILI